MNKIKKIRSSNSRSGQIVLVLVLITVVGLTVGLSLISRTVTDIRISSQIEQSSRAFSAAEAGVENALSALKAIAPSPSGTIQMVGANASYQVSSLGGTTGTYNFPMTEVGTVRTLWLCDYASAAKENFVYADVTNSYPVNKNLTICWGSYEGNNSAMTLTLSYIKNSEEKSYVKLGYDPDTSGRSTLTSTPIKPVICGDDFRYGVTFNPQADLGLIITDKIISLRIQPAFEPTAFGIYPSGDPGDNIPVQGVEIKSVGTTETNVVRRLQVNQGYSTLPSILDFALFVEE